MPSDTQFDSMQLTFRGPSIDDPDILEHIPNELAELLRQINGFIHSRGGLHVRGACHNPSWHSLRSIWHGDHALHRGYQTVRESDIPFAQDCFGDQFLMRD